MVSKIRRVISSPTLPVDEGAGDDCKSVAVGIVATVGSCILLHCGCLPLTSTLFVLLVLVGVIKPPCPVPLLPPLDEDVASDVGEDEVAVVGVTTNEVLLASIVGRVLICQVEAPSAVRA